MNPNGIKGPIGQPVPELPVADVERAQRHYRDALGFDIAWLEPDKEIGAVTRGNVAIFLRKKSPPTKPAVHWMFAEQIETSYQEFQASGANIVDPLETKPWGLQQFSMEDLDGNLFHVHHDHPKTTPSTTEIPESAVATEAADRITDAPSQATPRPRLSSTEAQLFVADIHRSCDFYCNQLGFTIAFLYGDPPYYGQVVREGARLNLRLVCEPVFAGDIRQREHLLSASITVATAKDINQLFLSFQAAGVLFCQSIRREPWGASTFVISDPDENLILFAGPDID